VRVESLLPWSPVAYTRERKDEKSRRDAQEEPTEPSDIAPSVAQPPDQPGIDRSSSGGVNIVV